MADDAAGWQAPEYLRKVRERREDLISELEKQSDTGAVNVDEMIRLYAREYDEPVLMLIHDIQTQIGVYANVVEALKNGVATSAASGASTRSDQHNDDLAHRLKQGYMDLRLIPQDSSWPNPDGGWLMNRALNKLQEFWLALRTIVARWRKRLAAELNLEPTMAIGFEMSVGLTPQFTITVNPGVAVSHGSG